MGHVCTVTFTPPLNAVSFRHADNQIKIAGNGMRNSAVVLLVLLAAAASSRAEVTVSLPTQGYYRPGKFFPVRIAGAVMGEVELRADGAMASTVLVNDGQAIVPLLALTASVSHMRWVSTDGVEHSVPGDLHSLSDREVLIGVIGVAGGDVGSARSLFIDKNLVVVQLDATGPLLAPASAWEVLDGLLLGAPAAAQLSDGQIQTLLAAGTVVVVHSPTPPDERWPWKKVGDDWLLRREVAGPSPGINPDVYGPTYSWDPGWPRAFRAELFGGASVFCVLAVAISLWRSRYAILPFLALCAVAIGVIGIEYRRQSPVRTEKLAVAIRAQGLTQYDLWVWRSSVRPTQLSLSAPQLTHPIFASLSQLDQLAPRLVCRAGGQSDRFEFHLEPRESLAMLTRIVRPSSSLGTLQPPDSRWTDFVRDQYLQPTDGIAGQTFVQDPSTGQLVSTIVIDRQ
jgi:hypothetical protein